ncbi:site-specific integrase [Amycolatopsis sp. NPDC004368]
MASIERRPRRDDTVGFRVVWRDPDTKKKDHLTFEDEADAKLAMKLLNANGQRLTEAVQTMQSIRSTAPTITEILTEYIDHLTGVEERTRTDYRGYVANHIDPFIGAVHIDAENLDKVAKQWVNDRWDDGEGMGGKTLRNVHAFLSAGIGSAIPKYRPDNPFHGMRLPEEMVFLAKHEFPLLLAQVPPYYQTAVKFLVSTGLRWGEFVALNIRDVELFGDIPAIRVTKAIKRGRSGHYVGTTKTSRGRRTVSIAASLVPELEEITAGRDPTRRCSPGRGARLRENNFRDRVWAPAVTAANAEYDVHGVFVPQARRLNKRPRIHDLRHTHASWLIAAGVDLPTVSRRLGYESIKTTVDIYGHLDPSQLERAAKAADAALLAAIPM